MESDGWLLNTFLHLHPAKNTQNRRHGPTEGGACGSLNQQLHRSFKRSRQNEEKKQQHRNAISSASPSWVFVVQNLHSHSQKDTQLQQHEREICFVVEHVIVEGKSDFVVNSGG